MIPDRYPTADVLAQRGHWDDATRDVIMDRVHNVPAFRHFNAHDRRTLEALCERVIPQADRPPEKRVPIAPWIDEHCTESVMDGFRFDNMPPNPEAWDRGLQGLDQTSRALSGADFVDLPGDQQDRVLQTIDAGDPPGDVWHSLPAHRWWVYVPLRQISGVYYAHPLAWDEIGFGGPAYPRGYMALNFGRPEPWEPREVPAGGGKPR